MNFSMIHRIVKPKLTTIKCSEDILTPQDIEDLLDQEALNHRDDTDYFVSSKYILGFSFDAQMYYVIKISDFLDIYNETHNVWDALNNSEAVEESDDDISLYKQVKRAQKKYGFDLNEILDILAS